MEVQQHTVSKYEHEAVHVVLSLHGVSLYIGSDPWKLLDECCSCTIYCDGDDDKNVLNKKPVSQDSNLQYHLPCSAVTPNLIINTLVTNRCARSDHGNSVK